MSPKNLGKYEIIDRLGRGGMAEVYRGYHAALDRYVAIKLLHPFLADDPEFKDRFENEARNVAKLKHPNIVQVYDFEYDAEGDSYYMVMEMINGPTLKDRLFDLSMSDERFSIAEAIAITRAAAEALAYAHQRHMIHRDVKPANLMLDEGRRVVLTDFGIAKIVTGAQFTTSGGMVGTPAYMAPEQGMGEAGDERSDIYSLGVILFQLTTGRLPYDADTPLAIILKHVNDPLPAPSTFVSDFPADLETIIFKAMAKEPNDRYQTAAEFAHDMARLDSFGQQQTPSDTPVSRYEGGVWETPSAPLIGASRVRQLSGSDAFDNTPDLRTPRPTSRTLLPSGRLSVMSVFSLLVGIVLLTALAVLSFGRDGISWARVFQLEESNNTLPATAVGAQIESAVPTEATLTLEPTEIPARQITATDPLVQPSAPPGSNLQSPSSTALPTLTPSPNLTGTALYNFYATLAAATPTPDMTQTIAACDFEYIVVEPERYNVPPAYNDPSNPRLARYNSEFVFDIVLRNTGSCAWPPGVRLSYNEALTADPDSSVNMDALRDACGEDLRPGLNFAAQEQSNFYFNEPVEVTSESDALPFTGTAPRLYGCYYGVWDVLYPNSTVPIGRPLLLTIRVWGGG